MSDTSPPKPRTVTSLNLRSRFTSLNRASEPYDAIGINQLECWIITHGLVALTEIICSDNYAVSVLNC